MSRRASTLLSPEKRRAEQKKRAVEDIAERHGEDSEVERESPVAVETSVETPAEPPTETPNETPASSGQSTNGRQLRRRGDEGDLRPMA